MTAAEHNEIVDFGPFRLLARHRRLFFKEEEISIGGRAMDILLKLAKRQGELVTKEDLLAAAWPNVSIHDSNLKVTIAALRRALRDHSSDVEYIKTVVGRGYWLDAARQASERAGASDVGAAISIPLPDLGTVIGRDRVIAELRESLTHHRLTTVVGAGGIGKTTVAVAAAQLYEDEAGGTATFVDLARVASEEFVAPTLAAALGIAAEGGDVLRALVSILARRRSLLVLDTCEHVCNEVAHICNVILANSPNVRIIATSRQVLRAQREKVVWLAPLEVPPPEHAGTATDVLGYAASQLLVMRAFESGGYRFHDRDARTIAEICRRLDGAPLAIEMVSPRLAGRSADTVLRELDDRLQLLRRDIPGAPLRQQTLLVTFEWSYALLTEAEACALRAISIFAGSFDTDSAVRVAGHRTLGPADAFDAMAGLRAKSMVSVDQTSGQLRYRLADSTRAFASALLEDHGELAVVADSHARLQLEIQIRAGLEHPSMTARRWHAAYGGGADDLRKAIDWALYRGGDPRLGLQLVAEGLTLWQELSLGEEARRNCERALVDFARLGCTELPLKLKLVVGLAMGNAYVSGDTESTIASFEQAILLAREIDDPAAECRALGALATFKILPGHPSAIEALDAMRLAATRWNDRSALWEEQQLRAQQEVLTGEMSAAHARLERLGAEMADGTTSARGRFHVDQKASVSVQMAALSWLIGKPGHAVRLAEATAREVMESRHGITIIHCLCRGIIWTFMQCHDYSNARLCTELLKRNIDVFGMPSWLPIAYCYTEAIEAVTGARPSPQGLRSAAEILQTGAAQLAHHAYFATLIEAMIAIGEIDDAARTLDFVFRGNPQPWILPELLRMRAVSERAAGRDDAAESTLTDALRMAERIGYLGWKLRAAHDLAVLLRHRGDPTRARQILGPAYDHFSDGFDTGDLVRSRELLEQLT